MDLAGNAIAVWEQSDGVHKNIWANRYEAGVGWGAAELIESDNSGDAELPQLGVDGTGNAFVVWQQSDGIRKNIWTNRYIPSSGWGAGELLETDNAGDAEEPQVEVNTAGNVIAIWQQFDGAVYNILSSQYTGRGWGKPELLENDDAGDAKEPQIAMNPSGNAIAVWWQVDSNRRKNIIANRYTTGQGWGKVELAENNDFGNAYLPKVGIDPLGRAFVIWQQMRSSLEGEPGGVSLWGNRYE